MFSQTPILNYQDYSGLYFSNSSFAIHMACDILEHGNWKDNHNIKRILVCNNLNPKNLGLTILEKVES